MSLICNIGLHSLVGNKCSKCGKTKIKNGENALIKKLGGYNISYTKEQRIAIYCSIIPIYINNRDILSIKEINIFSSIFKYLETNILSSSDIDKILKNKII